MLSFLRYSLSQPAFFYACAMACVVVASNYLVHFPVDILSDFPDEDWVTWGAFTYPIAFLVADLATRHMGAPSARRVALTGFALAVVLSIIFVDIRTALASGSAFLVAQMLDIFLFSRLRAKVSWWAVPMISSGVSSVVDTVLFFSLAFAGSGLPWTQWAIGDLGAKWAMVVILLLPYRLLMPLTKPRSAALV